MNFQGRSCPGEFQGPISSPVTGKKDAASWQIGRIFAVTAEKAARGGGGQERGIGLIDPQASERDIAEGVGGEKLPTETSVGGFKQPCTGMRVAREIAATGAGIKNRAIVG